MTYKVTIVDTNDTFTIEPDEPILEAAERAGIPLAHDCRYGGCGTCRFKILKGTVDYEEMPFGISEEELEAKYGLACQARATNDLVISANIRPEGFIPPDYHSATVVRLDHLSSDVIHLGLQIPSAKDVAYHPGQYINIMLEDGSHRSFSMASKPKGEYFDFHIRQVPEGRFTEKLHVNIKVGDLLDVELPLGEFRYRSNANRKILLVATGTGLAPLRAIVESLLPEAEVPQMVLYWGGRQISDLYMHEELYALSQLIPEFQYIPVLSRAGDEWLGHRGYVQDAISQDISDLSEYDAYICGSPEMVAAAKDQFIRDGIPVDQIHTDSFIFSHQLSD